MFLQKYFAEVFQITHSFVLEKTNFGVRLALDGINITYRVECRG